MFERVTNAKNTPACAIAGLVVAGALLASPAQAEISYQSELDTMTVKAGSVEGVDLYIGLQTAGRLQATTEDNVFTDGVEKPSLDPGFQTAWGSMDFMANFDDKIKVYWEYYISSRPHPSEMQGNQGYLLISELPNGELSGLFDLVDIKAGQFEVNFGDAIYRRSDNARTQRNPLVGNYVMDPRAAEIGMEIISKPSALNWLIGATSGTESGDFTAGRGTALHAKLWANVGENARIALSGYQVDHADNGTGETRNNLFRTSRSGSAYDSILNGGNAAGQVTVGKGQDVSAYQVDVTLNMGNIELYGNFGYTEDADTNGSDEGAPQDAWYYYALEAVCPISDSAYGAVRFSTATADELAGVSSDGRVDRLQIGAGYRISAQMLAKIEYVFSQYQDFVESEGAVQGIDSWRDPEFQGVVAEVSFGF